MKQEHKHYLHIGVTVLAVWLVIHYWSSAMGFLGSVISAASSLLLGCVIAYVVNIPMAFFERLLPGRGKARLAKLRRLGCMLLAVACVVLLLVLVVRMIVPSMVECGQVLVQTVPPAVTNLLNYVVRQLEENNLMPDVVNALESINVEEMLKQGTNLLKQGMSGVLGVLISTTTTVVSGVVTLVLALIFAVYVLLDKGRLGRQCKRLLRTVCKPGMMQRLEHIQTVLDESFHRYIVGQCTEALILGSLCVLGMLIFRFPYAVMIGTLVGVTALIPIAGAYIGAAVGAFMIFTISPIQAVWFLVFLVILQQLEGDLIFPHVVGSSIGLPGIWVLAAVTVFGGLFGIPGMVIGVPLTGAAYRLLREYMEWSERKCAAATSVGDALPEPEPPQAEPQAPQAKPEAAERPRAATKPKQRSKRR